MPASTIPPPPMFVRRVLHVIWPVVAVVVTIVSLPVFLVGCAQALVSRNARLLRVTGLVVVGVWLDVRLLVGCWRLWLQSPRKDSPTWVADHEALLSGILDEAMAVAKRWVGFEVVLDEPMWFGREEAPMVAFARHAGPADSIAVAWLLARTAERMPRIVLAEALRWDPGIDTILTRLHSYFVPTPSGAGDDRARGVTDLASSLRPEDVLLLFPEGQNWSPARQRHLVDRLRARGLTARARRAEKLRSVLPVKTKGAVAVINERPDADVMVVAHAGFGRLLTPRDIYEAIPFNNRPFLVHTWTYAADQLPSDSDAIAAWLEGKWLEIDAWVSAHEL